MIERQRMLLFILPTLFALSACQRDLSGNSSVSIYLPKVSELNKVSALNVFPANYRICYGVSVTATDISGFGGNSCSPKTGINKGFIESGNTIEMSIPRGTKRKIELYAYLIPDASSAPCPSMPANLGGALSENIYLIATADNIDTVDAVTTVNIEASFPGFPNHLAATIAAPASCFSVVSSLPGFRVLAGSQRIDQGTFIIKGRMGAVVEGSERSTSGGLMIRGKVSY